MRQILWKKKMRGNLRLIVQWSFTSWFSDWMMSHLQELCRLKSEANRRAFSLCGWCMYCMLKEEAAVRGAEKARIAAHVPRLKDGGLLCVWVCNFLKCLLFMLCVFVSVCLFVFMLIWDSSRSSCLCVCPEGSPSFRLHRGEAMCKDAAHPVPTTRRATGKSKHWLPLSVRSAL